MIVGYCSHPSSPREMLCEGVVADPGATKRIDVLSYLPPLVVRVLPLHAIRQAWLGLLRSSQTQASKVHQGFAVADRGKHGVDLLADCDDGVFVKVLGLEFKQVGLPEGLLLGPSPLESTRLTKYFRRLFHKFCF